MRVCRRHRDHVTVVLIHGGGATARFWDRLTPYLDTGRPSPWTYPAAGHGRPIWQR